MCRVKEGRVTKPGSSGGGGAPPRRRGRPAIDWTRSRKRRLLRLYLCTPESELSLKKILALLSEGPFQPKPRHTQCLLNDMLSKSYRQKRPKNRAVMAERLAYLRSIRDGRFQIGPHAARKQAVAKDCAILLKSNPGGRKAHNVQLGDASGEAEDPDSPGSPTDQRPDTASSPSRRSLDMGEPRTSLEGADTDEEAPSPELFRNPWSTSEDVRGERIDFLKERCRSRSSSFLADAASLFSGLSIRSGLSRSSSGSSRRSSRSVPGRSEPSGSASLADWDTDRPSTAVSLTASHAWSGELHLSPLPADLASPPAAWADCQRAAGSWSPHSNSHTLENQELVRFCCGQATWCLHQRIYAVLTSGSPAETFACTAAEVDTRDGLGNTALHVAARWAAPAPVLLRIAAVASYPGAVNHRNETFLHVLDSGALAPGELAHLIEFLAGRGGFDFTHRDDAGRSFVDRLMRRASFSLASLEAIFSRLSEPDRLALIHRHRLLDAIRARFFGQGAAATPGLAQPAEAAASYTAYFLARYGTAHRTV
ncbi:7b9fc2ce-f17d-4220-b23c-400602d4c128 [Thermothielavioides terrestris]|uniref:7b9fc2ce-f17d-4220-b23c-400602d4c128 n=1 Tax=Thermothielavioides terrestris TaxID=2587410 RepID=A0A446B9W6_9PEZI|nr:7b9fc2ce-f17d-4220-b23c-400602d4c128 [Thermothielavioides terrestris]